MQLVLARLLHRDRWAARDALAPREPASLRDARDNKRPVDDRHAAAAAVRAIDRFRRRGVDGAETLHAPNLVADRAAPHLERLGRWDLALRVQVRGKRRDPEAHFAPELAHFAQNQKSKTSPDRRLFKPEKKRRQKNGRVFFCFLFFLFGFFFFGRELHHSPPFSDRISISDNSSRLTTTNSG